MTTSGQPTELQRALARDDLAALRQTLSEYYTWVYFQPKGGHDDPGMPFEIIETHDADTCLALVALAEAEYDDPLFLGHIASEPLENIFVLGGDDSEATLERVELEAERNPRFRWMLRGGYTGSLISNAAADRLRAAAGPRRAGDDPLPPRTAP